MSLTTVRELAHTTGTRTDKRFTAPDSLAVFLCLQQGTPASFEYGRVERRQYNTRKGNMPGASYQALVETRLPATNWCRLTLKLIRRHPMPKHTPIPSEDPIVNAYKGQATTTSTEVARVFGKRHADVLRRIEKLDCSDAFRQRNFALSSYEEKTGNGTTRKYPMYRLTRDGFVFLAMGFTGSHAADFKEAYIDAFNKLEETLNNPYRGIFQQTRVLMYLEDGQVTCLKKLEDGQFITTVESLKHKLREPHYFTLEQLIEIATAANDQIARHARTGQKALRARK